ncbi:MAG: hypothetical protein CMJ86_04890 [Planctomycetes bacterium]|nr:hypothetical protein [Planctomycetota bacterium]
MRVLDELEAIIRKRGVRVEERLELLNRLRKSDPSQEQLNQRLAEFKTAIQGAARAIQKEIR